MIQAFRDRAPTPPFLHAVASSQGEHGGLKTRESRRTPQSSEDSHTDISRESCVELMVLITFVATHLGMA